MGEKRLDVFLFEAGIAKSRTLAQELIKDEKISVNGKIAAKPSMLVSESDSVQLIGELPKFVSRGGYKLESAINVFGLLPKGLICADIGASTGGFTDCMLQYGAKKVYALDVGTNQLDERLRGDERVISLEKTDIRGYDFPEKIEFLSADVSFISLKIILPEIYRVLESGKAAVLIKPQFEAGKAHLGKNGVIKDERVCKKIVADISGFAAELGFKVIGVTNSPILGGDGNREYLMALSK